MVTSCLHACSKWISSEFHCLFVPFQKNWNEDFWCRTGSCRSAMSTHCCGTLFSIYMLALGHLIHRQNIGLHFYTADTQIYLSCTPVNSFTETSCVLNCWSRTEVRAEGTFKCAFRTKLKIPTFILSYSHYTIVFQYINCLMQFLILNAFANV